MRELAAATADVGSAIAARFPRLTLVGDAGWDSVQPGKLVQSASRYWNIGPQLTVPIFSAGRLRAQSEAAASSRDAAEASYRAAVLRAVADAETGLVRLVADRERQRSVTASAQALAVAAKHEQQRYGAGEASRIEVLQAERALDAAEDGRIAEQAQVLKDYVSLGKSLGFGWQDRVGAAVAARADAGRGGEPTLKAP
jgi:outer membrane protein TolC